MTTLIALSLTLLPVIVMTLGLPPMLPEAKRRSGLCSFLIATSATGLYAGLLYLSNQGVLNIPPGYHSDSPKAQGIYLVFVIPAACTLYFFACFVTDLALRTNLGEKRSTLDIGVYSALLTSALISLVFAYFQ